MEWSSGTGRMWSRARASVAAVLRGVGGGGAGASSVAAAPSMPCSCSSYVGSNALLTARSSSSSIPLMGKTGTRFGPVLFWAWRRSSKLQLQKRLARNSPKLVEGHAKAAGQFVQDAPNFDVARIWTGRIEGTDLGKVLTPIAASAGFYLQDAASAVEEVVKVENPPEDLLAIVAASGFYAFIYFLVIPAIVYKRNAAELSSSSCWFFFLTPWDATVGTIHQLQTITERGDDCLHKTQGK